MAYNKEDRNKIASMYELGISYDGIIKATNCSRSTIRNVVNEYGLKKRQSHRTSNNLQTPQKMWEKDCPKCRKPVEAHGARFCPWCGTDVRSERQIVAEELERVLCIVCDMNVPADSKDRACNTLRNAIRLLKEEAVE